MHFFECKTLYDANEFCDWLKDNRQYPIEFYLNGITYQIGDERTKLYFLVGFDSALDISSRFEGW